ncbi:DUF3343 domain-containing protein [Oceanispirochaeta crateris]|jgi:hypothetical protein|uniref:DUF3343 domain-containing protein n=1 Tax=Oceanispirochaeta crateris TaxID=2518645 RepID=A0A5C1QM40_9SPIO|nr:DUF3343 domain-containing protein [Oceanispirochaeta crateris]QEN09133.1 DUF3343 domain-containing protein [Oceanispirochaeta crateris]
MHDFLFTFETTHQALKGEKYLKSLSYKVKLIPTPFEIFAECGFSLAVQLGEEGLEKVKNDKNWLHADCYLIIQESGGKKHYERV